MTTRMNVNETERTLVQRAREVENLREKKDRLTADLATTVRELDAAQQALAAAAGAVTAEGGTT